MDQLAKVSKAHDIYVSLEGIEVPEFEAIPKIGMMITLALHIRGLPALDYEIARQASSHYFRISSYIFRQIVESLAEIEFVRLITEGNTIKKILPQVPYFDNIYQQVGDFSEATTTFNEQEIIALTILEKLASAPTEKSNIYSIGAEKKALARSLDIGLQGGYIIPKKARGKEILLSPVFFSENVDVFADLTAKAGAKNIRKLLAMLSKAQGWPLSIIEKTMSINGEPITDDDLVLLKTLAQDGAVKPPSITTKKTGTTHFLFPPAPGSSKLNPSNREVYERAMALISSVRQGQFLADKYKIKWPLAILNALKRDGWLKSTSETYSQYHQLAIMKIGTLVQVTSSRYQFHMIRSEENDRALDLAISLMEHGQITNMEIDQDARLALQKDQTYIESTIASAKLRKTESIGLSEEAKEELDNLLIKGISI